MALRVRSVRGRRVVGLAVVCLSFASLTLATTPTASAGITPQLTVTPADDLVSGQQVQLTGTGFLPDTTIFFVACPAAATTAAGCDLSGGPPSVQSDQNGSFSSSYNVKRVIAAPVNGVPALIDCAVDACVIAAGNIAETSTANAPVTFIFSPLGTPEVTADIDGNEFGIGTAHATGLIPSTVYRAVFCSPFDCLDFGDSRAADNAGEAELNIVTARVRPSFFPIADYDCLIDQCRVEIRTGQIVVAQTPVTFPTPQIDTTIVSLGTLKAGTNEAVVTAKFTCDYSTRVSFRGTVRQPVAPSAPAIIGTMTVNAVPCVAGLASTVYITTRSFDLQTTDFVVGPATVGIESTPFLSFATGTPTEVVADTNLVDAAQLTAAFLPIFNDPANVAFREAVVAAIKQRIAQDPIFAAEFRALLKATAS